MMIGTRHRRHRSNHWCSFGMFGAPRCPGSRPGGLGSPAKGGVERYGMQGENTLRVKLAAVLAVRRRLAGISYGGRSHR
jgi:hypothetical protein